MEEEDKQQSENTPQHSGDRHPQEGTLYLVAIGAAFVIFIIFLFSLQYNRNHMRNEEGSDAAVQLFEGIGNFFTTGLESAKEIQNQDQQ